MSLNRRPTLHFGVELSTSLAAFLRAFASTEMDTSKDDSVCHGGRLST